MAGHRAATTTQFDLESINPGWFADNYMAVLPIIAQLGIMPLPLGQGLNPPQSNEDMARVIVGALTNPAPHIGNTYRPTGPTLLSPDQIAATFAKVLERPVQYRDISESLFLKAMQVQGFSLFMQSQMRYFSEEYRRNSFGIGGPTNVALEMGGQPSESFETIVRRYVSHSPNTHRTLVNQLKEIWRFAQILVTPIPDVERYEQHQNIPKVSQSAYAPDDTSWMESHGTADTFSVVQVSA